MMPDAGFAQGFENFKREVIPRVGQQLTVFGLLLTSLKGGMAVAYGEGEIYLQSDLKLANKLMNLGCHTAIKVTGTLQHYPEPPPQSGPVRYQARPEQFYFENPNIQVLRLKILVAENEIGTADPKSAIKLSARLNAKHGRWQFCSWVSCILSSASHLLRWQVRLR